jgi:hypothetical protein
MFIAPFAGGWIMGAEEDVPFGVPGFLMDSTDEQPGHLNFATSDVILSGSNLSFALHFGQTTFILVGMVRSITLLFYEN